MIYGWDAPMSREKLIVLDNKIISIDNIINKISYDVKDIFGETEIGHIALGAYEIILNAIEHGNLEITYEEKTRLLEQETYFDELIRRSKDPAFENRKVYIRYSIDDQKLVINIKDNGQGFDWRNLPDPLKNQMGFHGRGITLARFYFNEVIFNDKGNEVTLIKYHA